jgi:hypothetical protein
LDSLVSVTPNGKRPEIESNRLTMEEIYHAG